MAELSKSGAAKAALGKVWFVGAGPGAADLLTVRAIRVLARADMVLHDALLDPEVLAWAPGAELLAVGKRCGRIMADQAWINRALVDAARRHPIVVRLKGGDPTIFGRLDEEIDALEAAGIAWEILPGVTAASAAAAAAGVSLTRRGVARRVAVVTPRLGQGEDESEGLDWAQGLDPTGTVVLYMAGQRAGACARVLLARDFAPSVPVVVVRGASWAEQSVERCSLGTLAAVGLTVDERPVVLLVGHALRGAAGLAQALPSMQDLSAERLA